MEGIKSHPVGQGCRMNFTKEKPPLSSPGCDQRFLDRSATEKVYSADEITIFDLKLMRHSCGCTNKALQKHKLSAADNGQRCYISKTFQNGTQRKFRFSFSVHLWNYVMMLLPLLVIISSINSVTSNDDLCKNATWTSEVKCNCSVSILNSSSCGKIATGQNVCMVFVFLFDLILYFHINNLTASLLVTDLYIYVDYLKFQPLWSGCKNFSF